jgi:hypothetical protein
VRERLRRGNERVPQRREKPDRIPPQTMLDKDALKRARQSFEKPRSRLVLSIGENQEHILRLPNFRQTVTVLPLNWTTTTVPLWQVDCENFRRTGKPFELRDVSSAEHRDFVEQFAARYDMVFELTGSTARFQRKNNQTQPLRERSFSI